MSENLRVILILVASENENYTLCPSLMFVFITAVAAVIKTNIKLEKANFGAKRIVPMATSE